jgi:hypothetical protein
LVTSGRSRFWSQILVQFSDGCISVGTTMTWYNSVTGASQISVGTTMTNKYRIVVRSTRWSVTNKKGVHIKTCHYMFSEKKTKWFKTFEQTYCWIKLLGLQTFFKLLVDVLHNTQVQHKRTSVRWRQLR